MSKPVKLDSADIKIAEELQKIMGGECNIEDIESYDLNEYGTFLGGKGRSQISTSSIGKAIIDGNDIRRLVTDILIK